MNNLHRELAPISDAAWSQIEEETTRTLKRYLAGRRVVDVPSPGGIALPGVATGHLRSISPPAGDIIASQREVKPLVELRVPFDLSRQAIDDVERGSDDSDWQSAKDAAKKLAFTEDRAIFNGYADADIQGIREGTSNPIAALPADVRDYPDAVAQALSQLRLVGVNGPYSVLLGAQEYTALAETSDHGYPVLEHVKRIVDGNIVWAPAIEGAFVLTTRGGDFELNVGLSWFWKHVYHLGMAVVEVDSISKSYARRVGLRTQMQAVVEDVSLTIERGETLGLVGESGSGKTTLARMILGLVKPSRGRVLVDGIDVARASGAEMRRLRRQMQPVFQDPYAALNPRMKVLEIVSEPLVIHRRETGIGTDRAALRAKAIELLAEVGLEAPALERYPHEFSGGQRQRINIARALALRPKLLILDEPVSALDVSVGAQIVNLLRRLQRELGLTYLFISHSMPLVRYLSTRIAVMERGRLVEMGEAVMLCDAPREAYTRQLLKATPELPVGAA